MRGPSTVRLPERAVKHEPSVAEQVRPGGDFADHRSTVAAKPKTEIQNDITAELQSTWVDPTWDDN